MVAQLTGGGPGTTGVLYDDTYNHLTLQYADDLIERNQSGLSELLAGRPASVTEAEITRFLEGLGASRLGSRHINLADLIRAGLCPGQHSA